MTAKCFFCQGPVNPHDLGTWKQVSGWVGGERKDSMTMRVDTGEYAHDSCINKARSGQSTDQPDIFAPSISAIESGSSDLSSLEGLLEDK